MYPTYGKIVSGLLITLVIAMGFTAPISADAPAPVNVVMGSDADIATDAGPADVAQGDPLDAAAQLVSAPAAPARPAVPNHKKFAVVIGVVYENYDFGYVAFADRDAQEVYSVLTGQRGFAPENVILLQNSQATLDNICKALDWLTTNPAIDSESEVVFYYSGHGLRNGVGVGLNVPGLADGAALVPFDYPNFDFKKGQGLLWDSQLADYLSRINPASAWINIDSCSAGGFNRPGITGPNRVVTMSSQLTELSSEIPETGRGVFTQYLVDEGIARGFSIEDSFIGAAPRSAIGYSQNPQIADEYPGKLDL